MRPPPVRSDRSTPSSAADRITSQRTAPRRDGSGRGSAQHASESSRARGPRTRLEPVPDVLLSGHGHSHVGEHARACVNAMPIQSGDYPDPEAEAASMAEDLLAVKGKLAAMPIPSLDLDELARRFDDSSPPYDEVGSESALVLAETQVTNDSAPLEATPLSSTPFDQFGSMTASLTVEDALSLREGDLHEESGPQVEEPAEGGQEVAPVEEETTQPGIGLSEEMEVECQT
ncbi:unnamed protein product [Cochlearia groenlandica]